MRLVTFDSDGKQLPGLITNDQKIVDLQKAFSSAQKQGSVDRDIEVPLCILDIICGGEPIRLKLTLDRRC